MTTTRLKLSNCPRCDYKVDAATPVFDDTVCPKPGDFTICINCATLLIFTEDMGLSVATDSYTRNNLDLDTRAEIAKLQHLIKEMH
jgi:hypothetical protein